MPKIQTPRPKNTPPGLPVLKSGEVLRGRYRIQRIIGRGGMGSIYLAEDLRLGGRECAVKEVEHDRSLTPDLLREAREQFYREATVLAKLDHPNLPKVSDYFSTEALDYLVMDYIPGKDLRTLMIEARSENRFLDELEVVNWAMQLGSALAYMHAQQPPILHRDIKPSNLKLTPAGLVKLVDFGLVKILAPGEVTITILQGQGTAIYTPLEQYGGDSGHTDVRSDLYAFGATLYHLLTNRAPADARDRFLDGGALIPPRQINPAVSQRVERAILWAMSLHPSDRPGSAEEFLHALTWDRPTLPNPIRRPVQMRDYLKRTPERQIAAAAVILGVLGLLVSLFI